MPQIMKRIYIIILTSSLLFGGCIKKELVLPENTKEDNTENIDLIAKPTDVKFIGDYDFGFKVNWPEFSEKVKRVIVSYTESSGQEKSFEIEDFSKEYSFFTEDFKEYSFSIVAYDAQGKASKPAVIKATNKNKYALQVLSEAKIIQNGAYVRVQWNNELQRKLRVFVKNKAGDKELVSEEDTGVIDLPIVVDMNGVNVTVEDQTSGISSVKSYPLVNQGADFPASFKGNWTIFYDSPFNSEGWWNLSEAFDGIYNIGPDLGGTPKLNAVQIDGVTKLNSDRRIRTVYFTFTQRRNNINDGDSQYDPRMKSPAAPYDNLLIQELKYIFKAPENNAVWPTQVRVYGIKIDGTEVLIANISGVEDKLVLNRPSDPEHVKALVISIPQVSIESSNFRGIKSEIISATVPGNTDSWDWRNIVAVGEIFVKGVKSGI